VGTVATFDLGELHSRAARRVTPLTGRQSGVLGEIPADSPYVPFILSGWYPFGVRLPVGSNCRHGCTHYQLLDENFDGAGSHPHRDRLTYRTPSHA